MNPIKEFDPQLWDAIQAEQTRQEQHLELIASENYVSRAVLAAQGSVLTNKYAEGYPGKRYYGGCEHIDVAEQLAIDRARQLFAADYANVQPHSGSQANAAAMMALCQAGDTVLGMNLAEGGHLTHGAPPNFSGKLYKAVQYGLGQGGGDIDYDGAHQLALEHRPKVIIAGFSAFSGLVDWQRFRAIADEVGAWLMVDMAHIAGLVAAGLYPNPVPVADVCTTTTHKTLRGPRGGLILARAHDELPKKLGSAIFPGVQGGPLCHIVAAKALALKEALAPDFKQYQQRVLDNARAMAARFIQRGHKIVSGGTQNHLMLLDLIGKPYSGKDAEDLLGRACITVNKNTVPGEPRSPFITSGLRLGTPAITTRGLGTTEAEQITDWICDLLQALEQGTSESTTPTIRTKVLALTKRHPVYPD